MIGEGTRGPVTKRLQELFFAAVNGRDPAKKAWLTKV
jgi:branched-chain amino acid aminotransferase